MNKKITAMLLSAALLSPVLAGCAANAGNSLDSESNTVLTTDNTATTEDAETNEVSTMSNHPYANAASDFYTELYRQQIHYSPIKNWINDPNGMVYYEGEYHLFYQYNPYGNLWGNMSWGHAVSKDLLHWEELDGVAILCDDLGAIFSGSCVVDTNNTTGFFDEKGSGLVAIYTLNNSSQQQSIAYSTDNGRTWIKYNDGKPVLTNAEDPASHGDFRDPKVFWHEEGNCWMMVVAGGPLRFFSSKNLIDWKYESSYEKNIEVNGEKIREIYTECPDFFKLQVEGTDTYKWVMNGAGRFYMIGDFEEIDGHWTFFPDGNARYEMNFGPDSYAAQTYSDSPDGRRIMINWMNNWSYANSIIKWTGAVNGAMTIQNELTLVETKDGIRLAQKPIAEMENLRMGDPVTYSGGAGENILGDFASEMYELNLDITGNGKVTVNMFGGDAVLTYNSENGTLIFDRSATGLGGTNQTSTLAVDGKSNLQIFVDTASIEIYANDGLKVGSFLIFGSTNRGLSITMEGDASLEASVYKLNSIWRDLNTSVVEPAPLELSDAVLIIGKEKTITIGNDRLFTDSAIDEWNISKGGDLVGVVGASENGGAANSNSITLIGLKEGEVTLRAIRGDESVEKTYLVRESAFVTNMTGWKSVGSSWDTDAENGVSALCSGDAFYMSGEKAADSFKLTTKVTCDDAQALGIVLGCKNQTSPTEQSYIINYDLSRRDFRIFLFANGSAKDVKIATFDKTGFAPEKGKTYTVEITYADGKMTYTIDGHTVFENVTMRIADKYIGVMGFSGTVSFNNITLEQE